VKLAPGEAEGGTLGSLVYINRQPAYLSRVFPVLGIFTILTRNPVTLFGRIAFILVLPLLTFAASLC
jgi:hypothetical protein